MSVRFGIRLNVKRSLFENNWRVKNVRDERDDLVCTSVRAGGRSAPRGEGGTELKSLENTFDRNRISKLYCCTYISRPRSYCRVTGAGKVKNYIY